MAYLLYYVYNRYATWREVIKLLLKLDFQSEMPIYLQLKNQIVEGIATGKLKKGEALPSVRQLSADLGINLHTVNKTYNFLKQDGFIIVHRQKGVVVNPDTGPAVTAGYMEGLYSELRPILAEAVCRGMTREEFSVHVGKVFDNILNGEAGPK